MEEGFSFVAILVVEVLALSPENQDHNNHDKKNNHN